jgi:pimeloyl-ACP methyl ester carboxylesterase
MLLTKRINGVEICYDESGYADGPAVVLLSGWAHDLRLYDEMLPLLATKHRVIRVCWRGHGPSREPGDFGVEEQVADTLGLLASLDVDRMYLVAHSHGGWPALEMVDRLGPDRIRGVLMIDQIMTPPPPEFAAGLQAMQDPKTWRAARRGLFDDWLAGSDNQPVHRHFQYCMGSYGFAMWALSCRVIGDAYRTHGSPMDRMGKIKSPPPIRHIFSHPLNKPEYRQLHEDFAGRHAWFSYADLKGETHFPDLEMPETVVQQIEDLIEESDRLGRV